MTTIASISRRVREMTPEDELIGSLTKERVGLMVRHAGAMSMDSGGEARLWLAYALGTEVPEHDFVQLAMAVQQAQETETVDLEYWYDVPNTPENREQLQRGADMIIDHCVILLTSRLCSQLGVMA